MPTKCLRTLGEIRLDVQQQRICLEDVLCFLTSTSAYSAVHQRFTKLAKDGALATLGVALARTPLHAFRGVGGSRTSTCSTRYIKDPNEFTEIIGELVRHYHSALGKGGRQQGKLAAFWLKVQEFHLNFMQTWPGLWDAAHCKATRIPPMLEDVGLQYHELAPLLPTPSVSPKVRRSLALRFNHVYVCLQIPQAHATLCIQRIVKVYTVQPLQFCWFSRALTYRCPLALPMPPLLLAPGLPHRPAFRRPPVSPM